MSTTPDTPVHVTGDGVPITDGLLVWTNNLDLARVSFTDTRDLHSPSFDGWFMVRLVHNDAQRCLNGERLGTRHPFTRQPAACAVEARQR